MHYSPTMIGPGQLERSIKPFFGQGTVLLSTTCQLQTFSVLLKMHCKRGLRQHQQRA